MAPNSISIRPTTGVLVINLRNGKQIVKTQDEMHAETPDFAGVVIAKHLEKTADGKPIDPKQIVGWAFLRGFLATGYRNGQQVRMFAHSYADAWHAIKKEINATDALDLDV